MDQPGGANQPSVVFDMEAEPKMPDGKFGLLVGKSSILRVDVPGAQAMPVLPTMNGIPDVVMDPDKLREMATFLRKWFAPVVGCMVLPFRFIGTAIQTLIYGAIGYGVAAGMKVKLTFGQVIRLVSVALTPALLIEAVVAIVTGGHSIPFWPLISIPLVIGYTLFAVRCNQTTTADPGTAQPAA